MAACCDAAMIAVWLVGYVAATGSSLGVPRPLQLLSWALVAGAAARCLSRLGAGAGPARGLGFAAVLGAVYAAAHILVGGLVEGLGRSPYLQEPLPVVLDALLLAASSLGAGLLLYYILARLAAAGRPGLGLAAAALAVAFYAATPARLGAAPEGPLPALSAASTIAGEASAAVVAGLLSLAEGGPAPGVLFLYTARMAERLSPVLPDARWTGEVFSRIVAALAVYAVAVSSPRERATVGTRGVSLRLLLPVAAAAVIVWLGSGLLSIKIYAVTSSSMEPVYGPGDLLVAVEPRGGIHTGDIIVYRGDEGLVAHRVVEVLKRGSSLLYITQGDAVGRPDPKPVPPEAVAGKVEAVVPLLGWPSLLARQAVRELHTLLEPANAAPGEPGARGWNNTTPAVNASTRGEP